MPLSITQHWLNPKNLQRIKRNAFKIIQAGYQAIRIIGIRHPYLGIALSGLLFLFALAPFRYYGLAPLSIGIPLLYLHQQPHRAFLYGLWWGLFAYGGCFHWMHYSLWVIAQLPLAISLFVIALFVLYLALYPGLVFWIICRFTQNPILRYLVMLPATWTLAEWLRGHFLTGFTWGEVGLTQIIESPLSSFAPLLGIHGVTFFLMLGTGGLVILCLRLLRPILFGLIGGGLCCLIGAGIFIKSIAWTKPIGQPIQVALSQSNIPQQLKWDPALFAYTLGLFHRHIQSTHADLMILPESVFLGDNKQLPLGYLDQLAELAHQRGMSVALGMLRRAHHTFDVFNTVITLQDQQTYVKRHLVPFGEYAPWPLNSQWSLVALQAIKQSIAMTLPGQSYQHPIQLAQQNIAFNICYEDTFGDELIEMTHQATMLANLSNLAWFGPHSIGLNQHLQLSQTRALENGRFILRATNTGRTAIINQTGNIIKIAPSDQEIVLEGIAQGYTGLTPYMRWGDYPILILCIALWLIARLQVRSLRISR